MTIDFKLPEQDLRQMCETIVQTILAHINDDQESPCMKRKEEMDPGFYLSKRIEVSSEEKSKEEWEEISTCEYDNNVDFNTYLNKLNSANINSVTDLITQVTIEFLLEKLDFPIEFTRCNQENKGGCIVDVEKGKQSLGNNFEKYPKLEKRYISLFYIFNGNQAGWYYDESGNLDSIYHDGRCFFYTIYNILSKQLGFSHEAIKTLFTWNGKKRAPGPTIENKLKASKEPVYATVVKKKRSQHDETPIGRPFVEEDLPPPLPERTIAYTQEVIPEFQKSISTDCAYESGSTSDDDDNIDFFQNTVNSASRPDFCLDFEHIPDFSEGLPMSNKEIKNKNGGFERGLLAEAQNKQENIYNSRDSGIADLLDIKDEAPISNDPFLAQPTSSSNEKIHSVLNSGVDFGIWQTLLQHSSNKMLIKHIILPSMMMAVTALTITVVLYATTVVLSPYIIPAIGWLSIAVWPVLVYLLPIVGIFLGSIVGLSVFALFIKNWPYFLETGQKQIKAFFTLIQRSMCKLHSHLSMNKTYSIAISGNTLKVDLKKLETAVQQLIWKSYYPELVFKTVEIQNKIKDLDQLIEKIENEIQILFKEGASNAHRVEKQRLFKSVFSTLSNSAKHKLSQQLKQYQSERDQFQSKLKKYVAQADKASISSNMRRDIHAQMAQSCLDQKQGALHIQYNRSNIGFNVVFVEKQGASHYLGHISRNTFRFIPSVKQEECGVAIEDSQLLNIAKRCA